MAQRKTSKGSPSKPVTTHPKSRSDSSSSRSRVKKAARIAVTVHKRALKELQKH